MLFVRIWGLFFYSDWLYAYFLYIYSYSAGGMLKNRGKLAQAKRDECLSKFKIEQIKEDKKFVELTLIINKHILN